MLHLGRRRTYQTVFRAGAGTLRVPDFTQGCSGMSTVRVLLERPLRPHHLPLLAGDGEGPFEKREMTLELREPDGDDPGLDPLYEGRVDYALTTPMKLVFDYLSGETPVGLARMFHSGSGVLYRDREGLTQPADLGNEHTVAVQGLGLEEAGLLLNVMAGRDASSDEAPRRVPASSTPAADLLEERVDALITASLNLEGVQLQQSAGEVDFWFLDDHGLPAGNDVLLASVRERTDARPREVQGVVHALHEALLFVRDHTDRARQIYREHPAGREEIPHGDSLLLTAPSELTANFSQDFQNYIEWGEFWQEEAQMEGFLDVDRLIDERFLPLEAMNL